MKDTVNVSISGIAFSMDTEAYSLLKEYLDRIEQGYRDNTDGKEILTDIEARICELILNEQEAGATIPAERIRRILDQMGLPDDLSDTPQTPPVTVENSEKLTRRLYRNPEGAIMGGVCSGLGTYFNVEPVMVRLLFFAPLLLTPLFGVLGMNRACSFSGTLSGVFFLLYFLLLFAVPKAKTPRQKLEMKGEKITASSIRHNFQEDFKDRTASPRQARSASIWADLIYLFGRILLFAVKLILGLVAFILSITTISLFGVCIALLFGLPAGHILLFNSVHIPLTDLPGSITYSVLGLLASILILGGICYMLWRLIFGQPFPSKALGITGGIGIILLVFVLIMTSSLWDDSSDWRLNRSAPVWEESTHDTITQDTSWTETIRLGDSTLIDTVKAEYFERK